MIKTLTFVSLFKLYVICMHVISWPKVKLYVGLIICEHSMNGCVGYVYGIRGRGK